MLHKFVDFTQTILGTVALTGIIALSVITVNALNPSIKTSTEQAQVAGISTLPKEVNALPVQLSDTVKEEGINGSLSYTSDTKSVYKLVLNNLTSLKETSFVNVENLNNFSSTFNISVYIPQELKDILTVELLDNVNTIGLKSEPIVIKLNGVEKKELKIRLTPKTSINFPIELEFAITQ